MRLIVLAVLTLSLGCLGMVSCGSNTGSPNIDDAGPDLDADTDADTDTDADADTDSNSDTDTDPTGQLGEPCWNDHYADDHPNAGYPDCVQGYSCIGDSEGAWCTETCPMTGDINADDPLKDWCCGEMSNPCDPVRFWLPESLSWMCVPRSASLADPCENGDSWPSEALRCAPRCDGTTLVSETMCVEYDGENYCSFQCDPVSGSPCGFMESEFDGGCCEYYMGANWCTPQELCP